MRYELAYIDPTGDAHTLVTGTLHPQLIPTLCLRVADLAHFIPGLHVIVLDHVTTYLTFTRGNCSLKGEKVVKYTGLDD